ncbi:MAG: UpxY family transcription antiterminator [Flavobacteriaceae bacterium]|nr:UpxY family transcription antiterminator [Flavobacteriaceae bacterium]
MNMSNPEDQKNWYAIFTKPRAEKKVHQRMLESDIEAFLPLVKTVRQWSDRKKTIQVPLISSYVFVHMLEKNLYTTLPIHGTVNVLKHLGKPAKVKGIEIENLKILSDSNENFELDYSIKILKGEIVEVTKGPFMGLIATCEKTSGNHRVVVKIDSLGSCIVINVPLSYLRKIENTVLI